MSEQLSLAGFEPPQWPTDRLFFALFPEASVTAHILRLEQHLRSEHGLKGRHLPKNHFHVSLYHLGDYIGLPQDIIAAASEAAASVTMQPFEVVFDRVMSFSGRPGNQPVVLCGGKGVAVLIAFHQILGTAMKQAGLGHRAEPRYTPHLTLLYDGRLAEQGVEPIGWNRARLCSRAQFNRSGPVSISDAMAIARLIFALISKAVVVLTIQYMLCSFDRLSLKLDLVAPAIVTRKPGNVPKCAGRNNY